MRPPDADLAGIIEELARLSATRGSLPVAVEIAGAEYRVRDLLEAAADLTVVANDRAAQHLGVRGLGGFSAGVAARLLLARHAGTDPIAAPGLELDSFTHIIR